jgi:alkylated DNA repair dioxygenase AlkB
VRTPGQLPEGFGYEPCFVTEEEQRELAAAITRERFSPIRMYGVEARRRAIHYGWNYSFESSRVSPGAPIPDYLQVLRQRAADFAEAAPGDLVEALVLHYPVGASIGWHRDAPAFGIVIGVSLLSACRLRFRRGMTGAWETAEIALEPRSAYLLSGAARTQWQHSVPAIEEPRYSITFRTLRPQTRSGTV